jgi:hypothetical protein
MQEQAASKTNRCHTDNFEVFLYIYHIKMANFASKGAMIALGIFIFATLALLLIIINSTRTAGIIILAIDFMVFTLLAWLVASDVLSVSS